MVTNKWVDNATRILIFEALFYNVNTNLFSSASMSFEIGAVDAIVTHVKVIIMFNQLNLYLYLMPFRTIGYNFSSFVLGT